MQIGRMEKKKGFTISSWNINGIRTLDMKEVLSNLKSDIVAVQETKISRDQLDEANAFISDFSSFFAFSRNRNGYSGVGTYCDKEFTPIKAEEGLSGLSQSSKSNTDPVMDSHYLLEEERTFAKHGDSDGRCIITQHLVQTPSDEEKLLTVFNVYCPRLRDDPSDPVNNKEFKEVFHTLLERRAKEVWANSFVLIVGDLNISHKAIDVCDTVESQAFTENKFRKLLDDFLSLENTTDGFRDTFRLLHPTAEKAYTCWCTRINARQNNYGTRIDYIIASPDLAQFLEKAEIHSEITGSDHCPISATFHSLIPIPNLKHPSLSTKFYPELSGKQQKLSDFVTRSNTPTVNSNNVKVDSGQGNSNSNDNSRKRGSPSCKGKQMNLTSFFTKIPKMDTNIETNSISPVNPDCNTGSDTQQRIFTLTNGEASNAWKKLLKGPQVPSCPGHSEPCLLRVVRKKGTNQGRQFYSCPRGTGLNSDPNSSCNFFQWVVNTKSSQGWKICTANF